MRVLVTGAAGRLGRVLIPLLLAESRITELVAHDVVPIPTVHPRLRSLTGDIRDPGLKTIVGAVDAVIHMAFVVIESHLGSERANRALARSINLGGTLNVLSALKPHIRLIHLSSASVYGTSPSPIQETAALRPLPGFRYAEDKVLAEEAIQKAEAGGCSCLLLRPHIILGPHAQPFLRGVLRWPFYPRLPKPAPQLQLVHESDVARAIVAGLFVDTTGPINLASEDTLSFEGMQKACHRFPVGVPPALAQTAARVAFTYLGIGPDPAWSAGLDQPLVLDCARAYKDLAWRPRFPTVIKILNDTYRTTTQVHKEMP